MSDHLMQQAQVYNDLSSLQAFKNSARKNKDAALPEVAKQFEAIFIQMVLDSMRKANEALGKGLFDSNEMGMYQDMFDKQISVSMAEGRGIGLADLIVKQMSQNKNNLTDNRTTSVMPNLEHVKKTNLKDNSESMNKFLEVLKNNKRYDAAINSAGRPEQFIRSLSDTGSETDNNYAKKVVKIYQSDFMSNILNDLK